MFQPWPRVSGTARPCQPRRVSVPSSPEERQQQYWELSLTRALDRVHQAARVCSVPPRAAVLSIVNREAGAQGTHCGGATHFVNSRLLQRWVEMQPSQLPPPRVLTGAESARDAPLDGSPRVAPKRLEAHILRRLGRWSKARAQQRDGVSGQVGGHRLTEPQACVAASVLEQGYGAQSHLA